MIRTANPCSQQPFARPGHVLPVIPPPIGTPRMGDGRPMAAFANAAAAPPTSMPIDADGIVRTVSLGQSPGATCIRNWRWRCWRWPTPGAPGATGSQRCRRMTRPRRTSNWRHATAGVTCAAGPPAPPPDRFLCGCCSPAPVGADQLRGALVLVGANRRRTGRPAPRPCRKDGGPADGHVEIHANALDSLRTGDTVAWLDHAPTTVTSVVAHPAADRTALSVAAPAGVSAGGVGLNHERRGHRPTSLGPGLAAANAIPARRGAGVSPLELAPAPGRPSAMDAELRLLRRRSVATTAGPAEDPRPLTGASPSSPPPAATPDRRRGRTRCGPSRTTSAPVLVSGHPRSSIVPPARSSADLIYRIGRYAQHALDLADDFSQAEEPETVDPRTFAKSMSPSWRRKPRTKVAANQNASGSASRS